MWHSNWTICIPLNHFCYAKFPAFSFSYWDANSYYPRANIDCHFRDVVSGALAVRGRHVALLPRGARTVLHAAHGLRQVTSEASAAPPASTVAAAGRRPRGWTEGECGERRPDEKSSASFLRQELNEESSNIYQASTNQTKNFKMYLAPKC